MSDEEIRDNEHWVSEEYAQRIPASAWRKLLLKNEDNVIFRGRHRKLVGVNLGVGVYEISKAPLEKGE